ncbi:MAG TPA: CocE/NonD family hydrolase [Solirubrobacteraceae bacterium]
MKTMRCALAAALLLLALPPAALAEGWTPYDRPATNGITTDKDVPITMSDGIVLSADVYRPDKPGRYPVILTQTPYNKESALGAANSYLVQRGYVHVVVDVRGTGSSQGSWDSFGPSEQRDGPEVVAWTRRQPWSDGDVGLWGASYMAITQLTTAARRPPGLKAIFPIVPMADSYRDITFAGGQTNVSFIPLWLGLVTGTSLVPPAYALSGSPQDLARGVTTLAQHATNVGSFQLNTVVNATAGGDIAYDGPYWKTRSPLELADDIDVPAFITGGLHDLFQRGEPMIYERLRHRVTARLLMGPWTHVGGSTGAGLPADGVPSLDQIALRWFDHYLKGIDTHVQDIPSVTQYAYGDEKFEVQPDWPDAHLDPTRRYLRAGGALGADAPAAAEAPESFPQHPLAGVCTQSTSQWTAGLTEPIPCTKDDRLNEPTGATYTTPPMTEDLRLTGPVLANLWVTTTARDAVVSVRVTDVAPDGASKELSGGWLTASFRQVDPSRSRYVHGQLLQPWHPFTRESVEPVAAGEPMELPVEVFPLNAVIKKGHSLRVAVGPSDFPHAVSPLPQSAGQLGGTVSVLHDPQRPSYVALPTLGACTPAAKAKSKARRKARHKKHRHHRRHARRRAHRHRPRAHRAQAPGCADLPVPQMIRG